MRSVLLLVFLASCTALSQQQNEEMKKEAEFQELIRKANEISAKNKTLMDSVDKKTATIITKTAEQITELKQEVKELKQDLNENNIKPNTGSKFKFLPITDDSKDKQ